MGTPNTLPADFFDKKESQSAPDTLPAEFFDAPLREEVTAKVTSGDTELKQEQPEEVGFTQGIKDVTVDAVSDLWNHHKENVNKYGAMGGLATLWDLAKGTIKASNDEGVKTLQAIGNMDFKEAIRHLPGIVPGIGPAAVKSSEVMEENPERGIGQAIGLVGTAAIGPKIGAGYRAIKSGIKTGVAETLGKTTGTGSTAIREAMENTGEGFKSAMRGELTETELVGKFKDALQNVKQSRAAAYQNQLSQLPMSGKINLDITPIRNSFKQNLERFNIKINHEGNLDFSESTLPDIAAQNEVKAIYRLIKDKPEGPQGQNQVLSKSSEAKWSPAEVDALKRKVDDLYSPTSHSRAFVQSVKVSARNLLNEKVPGYQQMTKGYAEASKFIDALSDLSLESKNPGTAVRKLTTLLNQNNGYRQMLAEKLAEFTPEDLEGQLAGLNLNRWSPRGIMGPASGIGLIWGVATHMLTPKTAVAFALTSPRVMGELLNFIAKKPVIKPVPASVLKGATALSISLSGQPQQRQLNEQVP